MRFLEVIDSSVHGGAEAHTRLLSKALLKKGCQITLVCPPGEYSDRFKELQSAGGRVVELDLRTDFWTAVRGLKELISRESPQVVHSHKHRADLACAIASRAVAGVKKISTIHNLLRFDVANPLRRWAYYAPSRWALHQMEFVFTVCRFAADQVRGYFSLPDNRLVPLVNGIDLEELDADARDRSRGGRSQPFDFAQGVAPGAPLPEKGSELWVGCVGQIAFRKGQDLLVRSFAPLAREYPNARLLLVGEGPLKEGLEQTIRGLGLEKRVLLAGRVSPAAALVSRFDVYVQPSRWDPVPRAMLEAMALGVPVIASAVTGIPEIIEEGRTGLLMQKEDGDGLTNLLRILLKDKALRERLGQAGRQKVRSNCTMENIADNILERVSHE